ncbi:type II restriction endonuclease [Pseudomonas sp. NPDC007930]|uniref:type II restriction endonuclease n=1 Tax=Pseudomonas sp. NPDC007930 TaxID=3364417 RepID=UPI0036EEAAA5
MITLKDFERAFFAYTQDWTWEIQGFIDEQNRVYPIDSDTKVISTVFERLSSPVLRSIAKDHGFVVANANQTTYPDFTLTLFDAWGEVRQRIAIDIKTTYHYQDRWMVFTLGSYKSFIRNNTKNILYPYSTYTDHWVIGFIYSRNDAFEEYDLSNIPQVGDIQCPYDLQTIFIRDKTDIVGLRAGSGNTANIGSIKLKAPEGFATARGPFSAFSQAKAACDFYWSQYEHYSREISNAAELHGHPDFARFL